MDLKQKLGIRIRELRQQSKMSQESLAFKSDLDRTYVNSIENGKRNVSIININKIAKALDVSLAEIFNSDAFNK